MTVIKTWCPCCGEQELTAPDVHLKTFVPIGTERDFYEFICPSCAQLIQRPADKYVVRALRFGRVPETSVALPCEMLDAKREWTKPLTHDDMLDFAMQLQETDFLANCA